MRQNPSFSSVEQGLVPILPLAEAEAAVLRSEEVAAEEYLLAVGVEECPLGVEEAAHRVEAEVREVQQLLPYCRYGVKIQVLCCPTTCTTAAREVLMKRVTGVCFEDWWEVARLFSNAMT